MNRRKDILLYCVAALGLAIVGCGSGGGSNPPASISVAISNAPGSVVVSSTTSITAAVSNDSTGAGVMFSISCGSSSCGSVSPSSATGNSPSTNFTAPAAIPTGNTVTLTATSNADSTKSATATITITAAPTPVLADGNYVFHVDGEDSNGIYYVVGVFTVSNGAITGGEQDYIDQTNGAQNTIVPASSSLSTASNGNFQLVLATGNSAIGVNGVETFRGALVSGTHAQIIEFDNFAAAGGTIDAQTSTAPPSGGYAFNVGGVDGTSNANALTIGGVLNFSGTSLNAANSVFDYFDGGSIGQNQTFTSGSITAPDALGRVTITLTPSQASGGQAFILVGYIVGTNRIQIVESISDSLQGTLAGAALGQGANTGTFTAANVGGVSYAFSAVGVDAVNGTATFAGGFGLNANGTVSGVIAYSDQGADHQGLTITGGSWTVSSLGRVALSNVTVAGSQIGNGPFAFQLYLDGNGNGLELGADAIQGSTGPAYAQTATGGIVPGKYAIGASGFAGASGLPVWAAAGPVTLDGSLNWTGFTDYNVFSGTPASSVTLSGTTDTSTGLFSISGLNAVTPTPATPEFGYYQLDNSRVIAIEVDNNQLGLFLIEAVTQ
jgi:hypothetical protein